MTGRDSLFDELRRQKAQQEAAVDWRAYLPAWQRQINKLLDRIAAWLEPATREGILSIEHLRIPVSEPDMGQYEAPGMAIRARPAES